MLRLLGFDQFCEHVSVDDLLQGIDGPCDVHASLIFHWLQYQAGHTEDTSVLHYVDLLNRGGNRGRGLTLSKPNEKRSYIRDLKVKFSLSNEKMTLC